MRASSENAPGPSRAIVIAGTITSNGGKMKPAIASRLAPLATVDETTGVRSPASRQAALARLSPMTTQPSGLTLSCAT